MSPTSLLRRKPNHVAYLSAVVTLVFALASLVSCRLKIHIAERTSSHSRQALERYDANSENKFMSWEQNHGADDRRVLGDPVIGQEQRQLRIPSQFRLRSGLLPEAHPSRPYFVRFSRGGDVDGEAFQLGDQEHPLNWLVDFREHRDYGPESAFFFVAPKANGGRMKAIMTNCYNLRRTAKREEPESLTWIEGVLNIDTQTLKGLAKARRSNIIESGLVDVFDTSHFFEAMMLFNTERRGRAFTILQHPVLQAESMYLSRNPALGELSFMEWIDSPNYMDNWLVRSLTNDKRGTLTEDHLMIAKGVLARKFFIGIAEHFDETIKRLELYFGWEEHKEGCVQNYLKQQQIIDEENPSTISRGSKGWNFVTDKNQFDMTLYYYALEVFAKQGSTAFHRPYVDKDGKPIDFLELKKKEQVQKLLESMGLASAEEGEQQLDMPFSPTEEGEEQLGMPFFPTEEGE